jgi:hypothetical protein
MVCQVCQNKIIDSKTPMVDTPILCEVCNTYNVVLMDKIVRIVRPKLYGDKEKEQAIG